MIVPSWNCRDLARALAKRTLRALIRDIGPDVIFLSKTKVPIGKFKKFFESVGFYNLEYVNPKRRVV